MNDSFKYLSRLLVDMSDWEKGMMEIHEKRAIKVVMDPFK